MNLTKNNKFDTIYTMKNEQKPTPSTQDAYIEEEAPAGYVGIGHDNVPADVSDFVIPPEVDPRTGELVDEPDSTTQDIGSVAAGNSDGGDWLRIGHDEEDYLAPGESAR